MGDEPKRLSEIGQLLNRVDVPNLQYATRKLTRAGLIETEGYSSRRETRYRATEAGRAVTEAYASLRDPAAHAGSFGQLAGQIRSNQTAA
jgi:predicted MarR family transcription regulator